MSHTIFPRILFGLVLLATAFLQYRQVDRLQRGQEAAAWLEPGVEAPALDVEALDGSILRWEEVGDRIAVVSFWASWCLPCRVEMPELVRFLEDWNEGMDPAHAAIYIAVNVGEDPEDIREVTRDSLYRDVIFGLDRDGQHAQRWRAQGLPATFVVAPDGEVIEVIRGYDADIRFRLHGTLKRYRAELAP